MCRSPPATEGRDATTVADGVVLRSAKTTPPRPLPRAPLLLRGGESIPGYTATALEAIPAALSTREARTYTEPSNKRRAVR